MYFFLTVIFGTCSRLQQAKMATDPHESDLANGGAVQHSMNQNGPAVGSGLVLDCVGLFEFKAWLRSPFDTKTRTHWLHSVSTKSYLMCSKQNKGGSNSLTLFFFFLLPFLPLLLSHHKSNTKDIWFKITNLHVKRQETDDRRGDVIKKVHFIWADAHKLDCCYSVPQHRQDKLDWSCRGGRSLCICDSISLSFMKKRQVESLNLESGRWLLMRHRGVNWSAVPVPWRNIWKRKREKRN